MESSYIYYQYILLVLHLRYCIGCDDVTFMYPAEALNGGLVTDFALWTRGDTGSLVGCTSDCQRHHKCVSVFYNSGTDTCTAHAVQIYPNDPRTTDAGSVYYTLPIEKENCADILAQDPSSTNGIYIVNPNDGQGPITVYCDMTTDGGGWTVFQRREDGTVDFYQNWAEYKSGFGSLGSEFWLGNDILNRLTSAKPSQLRIDMRDKNQASGYAKYSSFSVGPESNNYKLTVSGYSGDRGDSLTSTHNGMDFSTKDRDQDTWGNNCALARYGGWWYRDCHSSNLNGLHGNDGYSNGMNWESWHGFYYSLMWTEMKLRPV
ncbi:microfibril-associated glycoprotein 4-like [Haliotis rubra]|uniref:microfibril-associated glycoprotein 4-like n=1 Tax=Haliotis rubra TaxID=36100 RepID=UPI001EE5EB89|nr:microfibril-associated glycoprotein 4-like [Haliotis rubra]